MGCPWCGEQVGSGAALEHHDYHQHCYDEYLESEEAKQQADPDGEDPDDWRRRQLEDGF